MRARDRIQAATQAAAIGPVGELKLPLDRVIGPTIGQINIPIRRLWISASLKHSAGHSPYI